MLDRSVAEAILGAFDWPVGVKAPMLVMNVLGVSRFVVGLYHPSGTMRVAIAGPTPEAALALAVESWLVAHEVPDSIVTNLRARARAALTN